MTTTCQPAFQKALYERLTADAELMSMISGVFDEVPEQARPPYLTLADIHEIASNAHDRDGIDLSIVINAWSAYRGYFEVGAIMGRVNRLLNRPPEALVVPGFQHVSIFHEMSQFMRDPDPDLRRCMARYRAWLQEVPA